MSDDTAAQARKGLLDNISGKAKEVAGAVTGKDDLVQEGQLQQAEARERKAAVADEAVAQAKRDEALQDVQESNVEAAQRKNAARAAAERQESAVERQRADEHAVAERTGDRQEAVGLVAAEQRADELAATRLDEADQIEQDADAAERRAAIEATRLEREAAIADQKAAELRAETQKSETQK
ncbi:MAG: hypothetical protein JWN22_2104 [Nocardioides sp.]|nr:hypothetical protein [Nocardioides sp.]